jgi:hypothetical protein
MENTEPTSTPVEAALEHAVSTIVRFKGNGLAVTIISLQQAMAAPDLAGTRCH